MEFGFICFIGRIIQLGEKQINTIFFNICSNASEDLKSHY